MKNFWHLQIWKFTNSQISKFYVSLKNWQNRLQLDHKINFTLSNGVWKLQVIWSTFGDFDFLNFGSKLKKYEKLKKKFSKEMTISVQLPIFSGIVCRHQSNHTIFPIDHSEKTSLYNQLILCWRSELQKF